MDKRTNNENLKYVDKKLPFVQNLKNVTQIIVAGAISLRDKLHAEPNYVQCVSHSKYRGRFHAVCESLCMKMQISLQCAIHSACRGSFCTMQKPFCMRADAV